MYIVYCFYNDSNGRERTLMVSKRENLESARGFAEDYSMKTGFPSELWVHCEIKGMHTESEGQSLLRRYGRRGGRR